MDLPQPGSPEVPDFVPQFAVEVPDDDGSFLGYLAIDSVFGKRCCGGIRMGADITRQEIRGLANAMSWKFAFMNSPIGGAKSGLYCPADADATERVRRLHLFGQRISPLLQSIYASGGDIGVGPEELAIVKKAAGLSVETRAGTYRGGYYTALGVFVNIMTWIEESGIEPDQATAVVEGYGSVGLPLARQLFESGVKVVGISNIRGALFNENGINVDKLEALRNSRGDECVLEFDEADRLSSSSLFSRKATIIVPGARPWSINVDNVQEIDCQAVIPAANIPVTPEATATLEEKGVTVLPDFVCNSAGIFGCGLLNQGFTVMDTERLINRVYGARLRNLIKLQRQSNGSMRSLAEAQCKKNLHSLRVTRVSRTRWLMETLRQDGGLSRLTHRGALELYVKGNRYFGQIAQRFPASLKRAAANAIYTRSVPS